MCENDGSVNGNFLSAGGHRIIILSAGKQTCLQESRLVAGLQSSKQCLHLNGSVLVSEGSSAGRGT